LALSDIRVRIAPSPTGFLHVGTARTALFNYLFAKGQGGKFILRIEDTDLERSQDEYTQNIFDSLHALGLTWDEGPDVGGPYAPYKQSERLEIYREWAQKLQDAGKAYLCYCTEEELDAEREKAMAEKRPYVYTRRCCDPATVEQLKQDPNRKPTHRFRVPNEKPTLLLSDLIRGEISFETALIGDFVLMKSNGTPSYNFAVVVDDLLMKITHVIRGEDHISNTPKQMMIFEALGVQPPAFAHVGMILAPDRSKLSKRHGATAVSDFVKQGYLPEAFCNFLSLLGWAPPDGQEVGTLEQFAQAFTLSRVAQNPAIFDKDKLNWLNSVYIRQLPLPELLERSRPYLAGFDLSEYTDEQLQLLLDAVREPITVLGDLPDAVSYFFGPTVALAPELVQEVLATADSRQVLERYLKEFVATADFSSPESLSETLKAFTNAMKPMKTKTVMWAIRAALTGRTHGADLSKTLYLLGKDRVTRRVEAALPLTATSVG
jgi:glutamyl-tRNA synthetase